MAWVAKHKKDCTECDRYFIVKRVAMTQDANGDYLDGDTKALYANGGELIRVECDECGAKAEWQEG